MSKRYGRNQKRKHREMIAQLEQKQSQLYNHIDRLDRCVEACRNWDEEIAQLLGKDSAFRLELSKYQYPNLPETYRMMSAPSIVAFDTNAMLHTENINVIALKRIMTEIRQNPEQYKTMIRLKMEDPKGNVAMYIDENYLKRSGLTARDVNIIAEMIARDLVYHVNKAYKHEA